MSRVLVVEDEAHLAQGLRFNLEAEGYAAEVVGDGEAATDRLLEKKENFDVVVLDIMLPGKDGFSVVSELRAARNYVPVLMLTARGRPEDVLKGFASGADDYLAKPFDLSILLARLQGLLRRSQWLRGGQGKGERTARFRGRFRNVFVRREDDRLRRFGIAVGGHNDPSDGDGVGTLAAPGAQRWAHCFAQADSGRGLGTARRYRHARHRQFRGAVAALH